MKPVIQFKRGSLIKIKKDEDFLIGKGEEDPQVKTQLDRESKILSKIYYQEENIPKNPGMEQMKKCDAKLKSIITGQSLAKAHRDTILEKQAEIRQKILQRKKELSKYLIKIENQQFDMDINELKRNMDPESLIKLGQGGVNQLSSKLNEWNNPKAMGIDTNLQLGISGNQELHSDSLHTLPNLDGFGIPITSIGSGVGNIQNQLSDDSMQHVTYLKNLAKNYRSIPCKNFHALQGCGRGIFCHFIHLFEFEGIIYFKKYISIVCLPNSSDNDKFHLLL